MPAGIWTQGPLNQKKKGTTKQKKTCPSWDLNPGLLYASQVLLPTEPLWRWLRSGGYVAYIPNVKLYTITHVNLSALNNQC